MAERLDGKIIERDINEEMQTAYIDYAMSVIVQRALTDVRDWLKPVHRRILYTMDQDGLTSDKPYRKSATTVGDVLGRYHPHGDASVYDAMVRLAQDFSMRYPLIDGHGNFGSIDGDPAAAYRYTEARLSKLAEMMMTDIEKNTVDFMPNFDDRLQEPTVLPAQIPALLVNGSSGIAVGMATNIPPHNLNEVIDGIIKIIRSSYDDAKERLMERFGLTDIQAQAILDMRLRTLSGLQREKIEDEYNELMKLIAHLRDILNSESLVFEVIKEELLKIKDKFGDERLTMIKPAEGDFEVEDLIKEEQTVITLTHFGYIKRMPIDTYRSQRRGGKGIMGIATREGDFVKQIFTASTHDTILFFSDKGKLYKLKGYEIPEAGRTAKGTAIVNLLSLDAGEKISAVIPIQNFAEGKYLLMGTKNGLIKKTALTEYISSRKTGLQAITLKDDDRLISVKLTDGEDNVVLVTRNGLCITFDEKEVRPIGRTAQGVIGIRIDDDDEVIGMESIIRGGKATLLTITENGFGKRTETDEYRVQIRGGKGVLTYKITKKTGKLVGVKVTTGNEDVMLITDTGTIIRLNISEISVLSRATQGVTLMRTSDGGKVVSIELLEPENDEEE